MRLSLLLSMLLAFFCFAAMAGVPQVIASRVDVTRVEGGLESEVVVAGWAPACSEVRVEPPKTIVNFSPDETLDTIEMDVMSCSGAVPNPRAGSWEFLGPEAWRTRRPFLIGTVYASGNYECRMLWGFKGAAKGTVDFAAEWRVVRRPGCDRLTSL